MNARHTVCGLLRGLIALLVALLVVQFAQAQNYSVTNLGSINSSVPEKGINSAGQLAFYDVVGGSYRTFFFNGTSSLDIGSLGGTSTLPTGLNASGQVVGYAYTGGNAAQHAFSWTQAGGIVDLGTLGGTQSYASGVNTLGQVAGYSFTPGNAVQRAFVWTQAGGMVDLGTLGGSHAVALAINDLGQVVGHSTTAGNAAVHAFSWTAAGGMVDLGSLGGDQSVALGVNRSGQVVGYSNNAGNATQHAFSWTRAGGMIDLGTLGGSASAATAINVLGQVLGYSSTASDVAFHPFVWTRAGGMVDLGTLGGQYAFGSGGINASGQVLGYSDTFGNAAVHAFAWTQAGGMIDLNAHIPFAPPGMELFFGLAVSDNGTIAAYANTGTVLLGGGSSAPVVGPIAANDPVAAGVQLTLSARFVDVNVTETHTAQWTWGDGTSEVGVVSEAGGSGTASGTHVFAAAGIYTVGLLITDSTGRTARVSRDIVVYDASAGFVTGEGWIKSPAGAYKANPALVGRATFGFVSRYQKGAKV